MIIYLLGKIMEIIGAMMICPFVVSMIYHERSGIYFIACGAITLALGTLICRFSLLRKGRLCRYGTQLAFIIGGRLFSHVSEQGDTFIYRRTF